MKWKFSPARSCWTFGSYAIELTNVGYELWQDIPAELEPPLGKTKLHKFVKVFPELKAAKHHAKGMAYQAGELQDRSRGRPKSADSCTECGAPPSHQHRDARTTSQPTTRP